MPLFWISLAVLLQAHSPDEIRLGTAAQASPRPRECRGGVGSADGLWLRAHGGDVQRYCDVLARGYARLESDPGEARAAAVTAAQIAGDVAVVRVLAGRAALRSNQSAEALDQFVHAEAEDPAAFADPRALHDYARAAALQGKSALAVRLYRSLASRSALFDDTREVAFVELEAAAEVLAYVPDGSEEALGYLAQARQHSLGLSPWIKALTQLVAVRAGHASAHAGSALPRLATLAAALTAGPAPGLILPPGELDALAAVLTDPRDSAGARAHWEAFTSHASADNIWLADARKRATLAANKAPKP